MTSHTMYGLWLEDLHARYRTDIPRPEPPAGEALVRVVQAGICHTDVELLRGYYPFTGVIGHEFVGVVEASAGSGLARPAGVRRHQCQLPRLRRVPGGPRDALHPAPGARHLRAQWRVCRIPHAARAQPPRRPGARHRRRGRVRRTAGRRGRRSWSRCPPIRPTGSS